MSQSKIITLFALLFLTNCAMTNLDYLRKSDLSGNDFDHHLARAYLSFSSQEADKYDWIDSSHFATKGLLASYGKRVLPEESKNWRLDDDKKAIFDEARELLLWLSTDDVKISNPELTANAQLYYDCWIEEEEEGWQDDDIAFCKNQFMASIEQLKQVKGWYKPTKKDVVEEDKEGQEKPSAMSYLVFFKTEKFTVNEEGEKTLNEIVDEAGKHSKYEIIVNGYTDTAGPNEYNMKLSRLRANHVRQKLIEKGIDNKYINIYAFGETHLMISTNDSVHKRKNRRVEIILEDK